MGALEKKRKESSNKVGKRMDSYLDVFLLSKNSCFFRLLNCLVVFYFMWLLLLVYISQVVSNKRCSKSHSRKNKIIVLTKLNAMEILIFIVPAIWTLFIDTPHHWAQARKPYMKSLWCVVWYVFFSKRKMIFHARRHTGIFYE